MTLDPDDVPGVGDARYRSYLLRLWHEDPSGEPRALLQDILSDEPHYFTSLESLFAYLGASANEPEANRGDAQAQILGNGT